MTPASGGSYIWFAGRSGAQAAEANIAKLLERGTSRKRLQPLNGALDPVSTLVIAPFYRRLNSEDLSARW